MNRDFFNKLKMSNKRPRNSSGTLSDEELYKRLFITVGSIILIISGLVISFVFFAPKIGTLFGLISIHRNENGNVDSISPVSPIFTDVPAAVKNDSIDISGLAEPFSTVKIYVNGPEIQSTLADLGGAFIFKNIKLIDGKNTIFSKSIDKSGNESEKSEILTIVKDKDAPDLVIDSPKDGNTVKNFDKRVLIKGHVNEKSTVKINNHLVILKSDFSFEFFLGVNEGNVDIDVKAADLAGNEKEVKLRINYQKGQG